MTIRSRGRFYENGPYHFCDDAERHRQPCTCAAPQIEMAAMPALPSLPIEPPEGGCYWPIEGAEGQP